jgi:hypothetical protein
MYLFKSKFNIAFDYFEKRTKGLIYQASAPDVILGGLPAPFANIGLPNQAVSIYLATTT